MILTQLLHQDHEQLPEPASLDAQGVVSHGRTQIGPPLPVTTHLASAPNLAQSALLPHAPSLPPGSGVSAQIPLPSVVTRQMHRGFGFLSGPQGNSGRLLAPGSPAQRHLRRELVLTLPRGQHLLLARAVPGRANRAAPPAMAPTSPLRSPHARWCLPPALVQDSRGISPPQYLPGETVSLPSFLHCSFVYQSRPGRKATILPQPLRPPPDGIRTRSRKIQMQKIAPTLT